MSNFKNPGLDLKKTIIITSSASALPFSAGLPLCSRFLNNAKYKQEHYGLPTKFAKNLQIFCKDGSETWEVVLCKIGIGTFWGCFRTPSRTVFPMMFRNGKSSFMENRNWYFLGMFWNYRDESRTFFPTMSQNGRSSL